MRNRRPLFWDVGLAAAAAAGLIVEGSLRSSGGLSPGEYVLAIAAALPLVWRTRAPLAALAGVELGGVLCAAAFHASWAATAVVLVQLATVAFLGDRQRSVLIAVITGIGVVLAVVLIDGKVEVTGAALRLALVFATVALADTVRSRQDLRAAARERAGRQERERQDEADRRAAAERLRIAQELHDTMAHSLVAINVRSSVALDLEGSQDPHEALQDIKQASVTALRDLRTTLELLREPTDTAPTGPPLDLDGLPGLLAHTQATGLHADLDVDLGGAAIPSAIGTAAYRIVQEALTNVLRHANATRAHVRVHAQPDQLDVEIIDDGQADSSDASPGLGLRGMVERSTALGGRISAGPLQDHGWRVHAMLPLGGRNGSAS